MSEGLLLKKKNGEKGEFKSIFSSSISQTSNYILESLLKLRQERERTDELRFKKKGKGEKDRLMSVSLVVFIDRN